MSHCTLQCKPHGVSLIDHTVLLVVELKLNCAIAFLEFRGEASSGEFELALRGRPT
jgi:hypothetical protein